MHRRWNSRTAPNVLWGARRIGSGKYAGPIARIIVPPVRYWARNGKITIDSNVNDTSSLISEENSREKLTTPCTISSRVKILQCFVKIEGDFYGVAGRCIDYFYKMKNYFRVLSFDRIESGGHSTDYYDKVNNYTLPPDPKFRKYRGWSTVGYRVDYYEKRENHSWPGNAKKIQKP